MPETYYKMFSGLLSRLFSSDPHREVPKLNQPAPVLPAVKYNYKLIVGTTLGIIFFKVVFHEIRLRVVMSRIEEYEPKPAEYQGALRPGINAVLDKESQRKPVLLYGDTNTGKTEVLKGFCASQKYCVMLETKGKWSEELNRPGIPVKFSFFDFRLFLSVVLRLSEKFPGLVFILDGLENLNFSEKKYLARLIRTSGERPGKIIVSSSEFDQLTQLNYLIDSKIFCLPEVTKPEIHQIMKGKPGYKFEDIELLWDKCEGGLEFALDMNKRGDTAENYLAEKKEIVLNNFREISSDPEVKLRIRNTLLNKNSEKPLGEMHKSSQLAEIFRQRGLAKYQDSNTLCYRNMFVFMTILEDFTSKIDNKT